MLFFNFLFYECSANEKRKKGKSIKTNRGLDGFNNWPVNIS